MARMPNTAATKTRLWTPMSECATSAVAAKSAKPKPALVGNASLNPPSPRGATRGGKVRLTLTGNGVGRATEVVFPEPGLSASIVAAAKPYGNRLDVDLTIAADARVGLHRIGVITPLGVPAFQAFATPGKELAHLPLRLLDFQRHPRSARRKLRQLLAVERNSVLGSIELERRLPQQGVNLS